jgi:hypothetical protein
MRCVAMQFNKNVISTLVGGLLLAALLGACSEINVTVGTCPSGSPGWPPQPPGACTPAALVADTQATSINAYDSVTKTKITDTTLQCLAGGFKCTSGTCGYLPCRTWYTAASTSTGNCKCGCNP